MNALRTVFGAAPLKLDVHPLACRQGGTTLCTVFGALPLKCVLYPCDGFWAINFSALPLVRLR